MRLLRRCHSERGSATVEFLTVGMLCTLPMIYLVLAMSSLQAGSLGLEGAVRQAARVIAVAESHAAGLAQAEAALAVSLADLGLEAESVTVTCDPNPRDCTESGGSVTVTAIIQVPMPLVPPVLELDKGLSIPMAATARQPVSEF